jgi:protoporphyrinogen oxidase
MSFEDEVTRRLGPAVAREFYVPYARKLYGVEAAHLDRELAMRRVSASGAGDVLRRIVRATRPQGRSFLYPRAGYGQLSEALAQAAVDASAEVRMRARVCRVESSGEGLSVCYDGGSLRADAVLSTLAAPALARSLEPAPPTEVQEALECCRNRAVVLAYLVVGRDRFSPFDAHYFPGPETRIARLSEPKNYRDGDDPPGRTVLCAEIPCWPGDELWRASDDSIGELVVKDLERIGLGVPGSWQVEVRRLPSVYPVYETATAGARATVERWFRSLASAGIVSLGRHGLGVLDNLHHMLAMGEAAAAAILPSGEVDAAGWSRSLDGFAEHVVED